MKVMTILGTRPEIIRLSRVIAALDQQTEHILVHTGQNYDYELNEIFFKDLEIRKPDQFLDCACESAAETVGQIIARSDRVIREARPDALLVLGDTNSCLAAYSAKRLKVPIFHMEAGNRCFDQRVPEEINRKIVDHIADINLPYSGISREYLLKEGVPADRIIKTGSPMFEVLHYYLPKIEASDVTVRLGLELENFFLVSAHREENIDSPVEFPKLIRALNGLSEEFGLRTVVSTHPRTRKQIELQKVKLSPSVELLRPLALTDYVKLELSARATLSDSGTITEESSLLNFPALNIRQTHERPEGMECAAVMMVGLDWGRIREGIEILRTQPRGSGPNSRAVPDYCVPNVGQKIVQIILSYTDYVNRTVWCKMGN